MIHFTPPPEVHLGPVTLNCHGTFFLLGAVTAWVWTRARVPREYHVHLDNLASWLTLGGIVGARAFYVLLNPSMLLDPLSVLAIWEGGLVSYGGFFGALAAWWLYLRWNNLPRELFNDAVGPPALAGWGVGRIGCFLNWWNEYGTVTAVPWGLVVGSDPPRHPVMLYLAIGHILAALTAARLGRRWGVRADGLALMGYGLTRFTLDFWRDYDPVSLRLGSQALAGVFLVAGLFLVMKGRMPDRSAPAPTSE